MNGLTNYLNKYYEIQNEIKLVSRKTEKDGWKRIKFLDDSYSPHIHYNHRSILYNEVVIEFDTDNQKLNRKCVDLAALKLKADGIKWAKWKSGNKSTHLHFLINPKEANRLNLLKSAFLKLYGTFYIKDKRISPDFRLCGNNILIRAEYGLHEKTGNKKSLISKDKEYPCISEVPERVWKEYGKSVRKVLKQKLTKADKDLINSAGFKFFLDSDSLRITDDGRERAMFMLIHCLKSQYSDRQDEFIRFIQEWYRYSSGRKLTPYQIEQKVKYHWNRHYTFTRQYLNNLLYELGKDDLIE